MDIAFLYPHSAIPYLLLTAYMQLQNVCNCSLCMYAYSHVSYVHVTTQPMHPNT